MIGMGEAAREMRDFDVQLASHRERSELTLRCRLSAEAAAS
jgi:hypothetical protein